MTSEAAPLRPEMIEKRARWENKLKDIVTVLQSKGLIISLIGIFDYGWIKIQESKHDDSFQIRLTQSEKIHPPLHIRRTGDAFVREAEDDNFVELNLEHLLDSTAEKILEVLKTASTTPLPIAQTETSS